MDRPGTAAGAWESWLELRHLPVAVPSAWPSVAVVAAHPDDEVLGVGGTIAMLAAAGVRLRLIAITDGEASHPGADPAMLGQVRAAESAAALDVLRASSAEVVRLRLPDTGLAAREDELTSILREQCDGFEVCLAPWEGDAHADHEAAGRAAREAAREADRTVLSYPIWMWHWARPADARVPWHRACQIPADIRGHDQEAISHRSLHQPAHRPRAGAGPVLPAGIVAHFTRPQEVLLR